MKTFMFACVIAMSAARAMAQPHGGDAILTVDSGRIATNSASGPERVFESEFGEIAPNFTDEPGFDCEPGTFPVGSRIGFRVLDAVRAWDGSDFDSLSPSRMEIAFSTFTVLTPDQPGVVEGFTLAVGSNGEWHRHYEFTLQAPAEVGVYLLPLQLFGSDAAIGESLPFWVVFSNGADEAEHEAAADWARENLAGTTCDPDVNCDGVPDQDDVTCMILAVAGDPSCFCQSDPDFNRDGVPDQGDVADVVLAVAGASCP